MSFKIENERIYTLRDIHELTGHHVYTLRRWIKEGRLAALKTGRAYHVDGWSLRQAFLHDRDTEGKDNSGTIPIDPCDGCPFVDSSEGTVGNRSASSAVDAVNFQDDI